MSDRRTLRSGALELLTVVLFAAVSLGFGIVIILLTSADPARAIQALLVGAVANGFQFGTMLASSVPYLLTGLAVVIAFKASVFNIGAEGQLYIGALAAAAAALYIPGLPAILHVAVVLVAGALGGAAFGAIPGYCKAVYAADEIVVTLMLNFVAVLTVSYLVAGPMIDPGGGGFPQTAFVPESARLPGILPPSRLHLGFFIALALAVASWAFLRRTTLGYEIRMSGLNPEFARYGGISPRRAIILAMVVSGGLAGVAGALQVIGDQGRLIDRFSSQYGFVGILIALLARNNPLFVPLAAIFYAYLETGAAVMEQTTDVPREVVIVVQAILFLLITSQALLLWLRRRREPGAGPAVREPEAKEEVTPA